MKPHFVEWYNWHVGYVDNFDCMANSFSMSGQTFKRNTKLFLNFLDRRVLSSWLLLFHVGTNISTEISGFFWWEMWLRKLESAKIALPPDSLEEQMRPQQMICDSIGVTTRLGQRNHQPNSAAVCSSSCQMKGTVYKCDKCDVGLCLCLVSRNFTEK